MTDVAQQGTGDTTEVVVAQTATPELQLAVTRAASEDLSSPIEVEEILRDNRDQVLAVVARILAKAGVNVQFAQPQESTDEGAVEAVLSEDQAQTELSPELAGFMGTLLERFDKNAHSIACHTPENGTKLEAKLRANPKKLAALKKMDELGGAPDLTEVDGEDFLFDDLAKSLPDSRRDVTYQQAVGRASAIGGGATLTHPDRYLKLGNEMNIVMDAGNDWVWLDTAHRRDLLGRGSALYGVQYDGGAYVDPSDALSLNAYGAFRCSLRV
jgi:hypothetical protein